MPVPVPSTESTSAPMPDTMGVAMEEPVLRFQRVMLLPATGGVLDMIRRPGAPMSAYLRPKLEPTGLLLAISAQRTSCHVGWCAVGSGLAECATHLARCRAASLHAQHVFLVGMRALTQPRAYVLVCGGDTQHVLRELLGHEAGHVGGVVLVQLVQVGVLVACKCANVVTRQNLACQRANAESQLASGGVLGNVVASLAISREYPHRRVEYRNCGKPHQRQTHLRRR